GGGGVVVGGGGRGGGGAAGGGGGEAAGARPLRTAFRHERAWTFREIVRLRDTCQFPFGELPPLLLVGIAATQDHLPCRAHRERCGRTDPFGEFQRPLRHLLGRHDPRHQPEPSQ